MHWQDILTIVIPIIGMMTYFYNRLEKKSEERFEAMEKRFEKVDQRFEKVDQRFEKVDQRFNQVDQQLQSIDRRLTRLEGRFDERGYWESREYRKTGTEDKK